MPLPDSIDSGIFFNGSRPSLSDDGSRIAYSYVVRPQPDRRVQSTTIVTVVADTTTGAIIATVRTAEIYKAHQTQRLESAISGDGTEVYMILAEGVTGTLYRYDFAHPGLEPILTDISRPQQPARLGRRQRHRVPSGRQLRDHRRERRDATRRERRQPR